MFLTNLACFLIAVGLTALVFASGIMLVYGGLTLTRRVRDINEDKHRNLRQ